MTTQTIVSKTAKQSGFGQDFYKNVIGLTREEKQAIKNGAVVIFDSGRLSGGNHGTTMRYVIHVKSRFYPRVYEG